MNGYNRFASGLEFEGFELENLLLGLGRLMGLAVRTGVPLPNLRLSPSLIQVLHMDGRAIPADPRELLAALGIPAAADPDTDHHKLALQLVFHPTFLVRQGIVDVVGPAGAEVLSPDAWAELFLGPPACLSLTVACF